jgi:hypothetical protein
MRSVSFDEYCLALDKARPLNMSIKMLRIVEGIITNVIVGAVAFLAIRAGAEPTLVGTLAIIGLGLLNGIKFSEWLAALEVLTEARATATDRDRRQQQASSPDGGGAGDESNRSQSDGPP